MCLRVSVVKQAHACKGGIFYKMKLPRSLLVTRETLSWSFKKIASLFNALRKISTFLPLNDTIRSTDSH